jgi:hypothetical protein
MNPFKDWLDAKNLSPDHAALIFGKSSGTIRNWRSAGVPELLRPWVEKKMAEIDSPRSLPDRVTLEITAEQFDEWSRAALAEGKILRTWAIDVLDQQAAEDEQTGSGQPFNPLQSLKVAEPGWNGAS